VAWESSSPGRRLLFTAAIHAAPIRILSLLVLLWIVALIARTEAWHGVRARVGPTLAIGETVRLGVALPEPRCAMPNRAQEDLPRDPGILKALPSHNRIDVGGALYPRVRVHAVAEATAQSGGATTSAWPDARPPAGSHA
jgi:hypothetical protein